MGLFSENSFSSIEKLYIGLARSPTEVQTCNGEFLKKSNFNFFIDGQDFKNELINAKE